MAGMTGVVAAVGLCACGNPFKTTESDLGLRIEPRRLRTIDEMNMSSSIAPVVEDDRAESEKLKDPPPDPFAGMDHIEVSIEQARVWALAGNLDLRVSLMNPSMSQEQLNTELAKFESVFTLDGTWGEFNQPTSSSLDGSEFDAAQFTPRVTVPLRTGGTVTLEAPFGRNETDNEFSTLNPSYESDFRFSISQPLLRNAGRETQTHSIRIAALQDEITQAQAKLSVIRELATVDRVY